MAYQRFTEGAGRYDLRMRESNEALNSGPRFICCEPYSSRCFL
jgi:hypothetical protein